MGGTVGLKQPGSARNMRPMLEQILQENRELRDAYTQATQRIAALEEGQNRFFDEGIYDLINAAHRSPGGKGSSACTGGMCIDAFAEDSDGMGSTEASSVPWTAMPTQSSAAQGEMPCCNMPQDSDSACLDRSSHA